MTAISKENDAKSDNEQVIPSVGQALSDSQKDFRPFALRHLRNPFGNLMSKNCCQVVSSLSANRSEIVERLAAIIKSNSATKWSATLAGGFPSPRADLTH